MWWAFAIILALLWTLGLATSYTLGGFIHLLLVMSVGVLVVRVMNALDQRGRGQRAAG